MRRRGFRLTLIAVLVAAALFVGPYAWVQLTTDEHTVADVPSAPVALVLGAGLNPDGTPRPYLADRLAVAADLYRTGKIKAVLVSGDHGTTEHDEVAAMTRWLVDEGVPERKVVSDHAGFDTNDSCIRSNRIFGVTEAIVITQDYALPRAIYLCRRAGIETNGIGAPAIGGSIGWYRFREVPASAKAVLDVIFGAQPRFLGGYEPALDEAVTSE